MRNHATYFLAPMLFKGKLRPMIGLLSRVPITRLALGVLVDFPQPCPGIVGFINARGSAGQGASG